MRVKFLIAVAILFVTPAQAADWPGWLGPDRNGRSTESVSAWNEKLDVDWKVDVDNGFSSPIISGNKVFLHTTVKGQDSERVAAYELSSGKPVWSDEHPRPEYRSELGVGPRATPIISDGQLFTMGITGVLSCYDVETGHVVWRKNPFQESQTAIPGFGVCASPLVVHQRVIVPVGGSGNGIMVFNAEDGNLVWSKLDEPAGSASPIILKHGTDQESTTILVQTSLRLAAMKLSDGEIQWEHPLVFQPTGVAPTPLLLNDFLICTTQDNGTLALKLPESGIGKPEMLWWNHELSSYFSTGTIDRDKNHVILVTNSFAPLPRADLRCIEVSEGKEVWNKTGLGYFHFGTIRLSDGKLLILDDAGQLILANGDGKYEQLAKSKIIGGTFCQPTLSDGWFVARDGSQLVGIRLKDVSNVVDVGGDKEHSDE